MGRRVRCSDLPNLMKTRSSSGKGIHIARKARYGKHRQVAKSEPISSMIRVHPGGASRRDIADRARIQEGEERLPHHMPGS